jgi:hypothetical protein
MRKTAVRREGGLVVACALALLVPAVAGAAPAWLAPVQLSVAGSRGGDPQVAVDARGNAVALWEAEDNGVQAAFRPEAERAWQRPVVLSQGLGMVGRAALGVEPASGAVLGAWPRGNTVQIAEGVTKEDLWKMPATLPIVGWQAEDPHVAVDARGDALATWKSSEVDSSYRVHESVQTTYRPAGSGNWQAPESLPGVLAYGESGFWVALDPQGNALAVWVQPGGGAWTVEASSRSSSGEWQTPTPVSASWPISHPIRLGPIMLGAQVALDAQGDAVAVWEHYMQENWFIEAAVRPAASGMWQAPVRLSTAGLGGARPDLALDAQGNAVVVWEGATATQRTVEAAAGSAVSGVWRAPARLAAWHHLKERGFLPWKRPVGYEGAPPPAKPSIALDAQGGAVAVWEHSVTHYSGVVQAAHMSAGSDTWQAAVDVAAASAEGVQVASAPDGEALAVWGRLVDRGPDAIETSALAKLAITRAHLSNGRFRVARHRSGHSITGPTGASLYFTLSEPAEVKVAITHSAPGVRSYDGCVAPAAARRRPRPERCTRRVTLVTLRRSHEPAGLDSVHISGRVAHHTLGPGTYRATITAGTVSTLSAPVTLSFTVVPW